LEDTNPDNLEPDAYKWIPEDANWLTENGVDEVVIQSDRIDIYNAYALKLLEEGHAYVCTCSSDVFKEKLDNKSLCECRKNTEKKNLERWHHMLTDWDDGDAVVRFKTDPDEKNPAFKEFPLARINTSEHPRQGLKHRVWPLMNLAVAVDDYELGITHAVRGKDHTDNAKKQAMIAKALKASTPESVSVGLISFQGFDLSTTQTKKTIKEGGFKGWDDIRLPFLRAMKRKGYQAAALRKFAITMGVTLNDKSVSQEEFFKTLNAFNKEVIDPVANRYFAVIDPVVITIRNAPRLDIESDLHPDNKKGGRKFKTHENFYIEKDDFKDIKDGELVRLMGCLNFTKKGKNFEYVSKEYEVFKGQGKKQIHWLPQDQSQLIKVKIKLNDNKDIEAFAEKMVEKVKENDMVQFERFGFCRCDAKNSFWFTHR
jgi:glutamyl-tRNA synthetase